MSRPVVLAAGGVLWRDDDDPQVALVHRPQYDDWSLPKGKAEPDEALLETAVREIGEEIGSTVSASRRIGTVRYLAAGARKTVTYWVMHHTGGDFVASDEVDQLDWLTPRLARRRLSYDLDRTVLADFTSVPVSDAVIVPRAAWRPPTSRIPARPSWGRKPISGL